jgi:hypothetical protein
MKFDHIGIFVKGLSIGRRYFKALFPIIQTGAVIKDELPNYIAYQVEDFDFKILEFRLKGCVSLSKAKPTIAFGRARVMFFLSPLEVIIELIENKT